MESSSSLRSWWMSTLAQSSLEQLEPRMSQLGQLPDYTLVRGPDIGLVTVQGRAGGTGQRFVLGEVPITRCVIQIPYANVTGFSYIQGRRKRLAQLAAVCDGLLQLDTWHQQVLTEIVDPLSQAAEAERQQQWQTTAATQVEFFNLVREHS